MNFPMFLCFWEEAGDFGFHKAIMDDTSIWAFVGALVVGGLIAGAYYFIVGKSARNANKLTWSVALIISLVVNFLLTSMIFVGEPVDRKNGVNKDSLVYECSFFRSIDKHATDLIKSSRYGDNEEAKDKINNRKKELTKELDRGDRFVVCYELSCLIWTLVGFVLCSYCIKNMTQQASHVPTYWPQKKIGEKK